MEKGLLQELAAAGAVLNLTARGIPGGYVLIAQTEGGERLIETQRGQTRVFSRLDTVAAFVRSVGLNRLSVEIGGWDKSGLL